MKKNIISAVVLVFVTFAVILAAHELSKSDMESVVISETYEY